MSSNIRRFFMQLCKRPSRVHFGVGIVGRVETSLGNDSKRVPPKIHGETISPPPLFTSLLLCFYLMVSMNPVLFALLSQRCICPTCTLPMITIDSIPLKSVDQCPNVYDRMVIVILRFPSFMTLINRAD